MDKFIGILFLVVVVAGVAIGSVVTYQMAFTNKTPTADMYGSAYSAKTNASNAVGTSVAPAGIATTGYLVIPLVILGLICIGAIVFKALGRGGSSGMR